MADSRLRQLLALVEARVASKVSGLTILYGAKQVSTNGRAPRLVWVRDGEGQRDTYEPPTDASALSEQLSRIVAVRRCTVLAHCWGESEAAAEELLDVLVWALLEELGPTAASMRGSWALEGWTGLGSASVLEFEVVQPIFEPSNETTTTQADTTSFDSTGSTTTDGQLDAGEG